VCCQPGPLYPYCPNVFTRPRLGSTVERGSSLTRASGITESTVLCAPPELSFAGLIFAFGLPRKRRLRERNMHGLIYLIGLIVVILFILSLFGLR
jgi:hypothetical protein